MRTPESRPSRGLGAALVLTVLVWPVAQAGDVAAAGSRWLPAGSAPALGRALPAPAGEARQGALAPGIDARSSALAPASDARDHAPAPLIFPDGQGLPAGSGLAAEGALLYQAQCASCHGRHGEGNTAPELVGGNGPLSSPDADKTIATYWPYATTVFDTIRRSMPPAAPGRLSDDQVYALCAWVLAQNGLWPAGQALDAVGLAAIRMPNRDGFIFAVPP